MQGETLTVRVVSKDGTDRYEMKSNQTVQDLKKKIQQNILIPASKLTLSLDRAGKEVLTSGANTLHSLGIRHGQMVFLSYEGERPINEKDDDPKKLKNIKKQWDLKSLMTHMENQGLVFKAQETTHCKTVSLDFASCDKFQQYLAEFGFQRRREGFLYGRYEESGDVTVEYIYEPPQEVRDKGVVVVDDPREANIVDVIANSLGLQWVGWIFSVPPGERDYIMSSFEVVRAAKLHAEALKKYPDLAKSFVVVKVSVDEEHQVHFESFQVTDQAIKLTQNDLIKPPSDPKVVMAKQEVVMARAGAGRKDSPELDPDVLVKPIAIINHTGPLYCNFPIENRPEHPQDMSALKRHMTSFKAKPFLLAVSDFHFIRFLAKEYLSPETDIPALCSAVKSGDSDSLEGFKLLITSIAGL